MNNEIKEILDYISDSVIEKEKEKWNKVKDYITNLQQELEEYKDTETYSKRFLYKANKDRLNANLELVKENERLKTKTKEQSLLLIDYQDMEQKLEDYKSRCEKAVEYIMSELVDEWSIKNDGYVSGSDLPVSEIIPLLNILNGRS